MRILIDNTLSGASLSATSTATESAINNIVNGNLFDYWQPAATGVQTITATFAADSTVDAIGIAGHNFFDAGITSITVRLYDNVAALISTDVITVIDDKIILQPLTSGLATSAQIEFTVSATLPRMASIYLGESVYTARSPRFGAELPYLNNLSRVTRLKSQAGVVLGSIEAVVSGIKFTLAIDHLDLTFIQNQWVPFAALAMTTPFFISLSDAIPNVIYGHAESINNPKLTAPNLAAISLPINGVLS